ncbi:Conserved oligomeric [Takifugu flavidus]|uniref:Conserved oligomeric Golgi complex subunit 1 n=1 Tax=Takifugu flavidus TaxID=433684 RepID=A0A5C6NUF6_9TELE|nr:Conserved oligomeric [Takifugu flavidus]
MADGNAFPLRLSEIKDPAVLFERYNTEQIRRIERKVRGEIEQKKEELRQMVGERYRDLIDAADTIREMRQCSESVVESVQDMQQYCQTLKQGRRLPSSSSSSSLENQQQLQEKFYTMASQIKLLLDIPERIWSAMEASRYLEATQLYLLCCHLHNLLQLETTTSGHYSPVLLRFPILVRQVATTGHFRSTILLDSKSLLRGRAVSDQAIAEALVSTMLLEDSSPRQALADFLLARKASIHQLLNQPQHGAGIKAQVCSVVELLVTTLFQAYAVFYSAREGGPRSGEGGLSYGLLFSTLENVTFTTPAVKGRRLLQEETSTGGWFKYVPPSITEFQPTLRTLAQPIQSEQLRDTLQQWIHTCKEDICHGVGSLLVYVKSLKGLAAIRDAVWDLLSTDSISQHWNTVCQRLLERPLAVWDDFLQQLFLQRLQAITKEETEAISMSSVQLLKSAIRDLESQTSLQSLESPGDLSSDAGWVSVSQRGQQRQRSNLAMKTQALTPCIQNFCSAMDAKLHIRLEDLQYYLPSQDTATSWEDLEIQEEAESGNNVTSKIHLPVQPSWFVQSLLFQLCVEVNKVGAHALPRPTLQELLQACLNQALQKYQSLIQQPRDKDAVFPMTQNRALQLLFDLRFLYNTLGSRLEEGKSTRSQQDPRFHEVCEWLESFIDPFDLDVFTPPLNANLNRLSQRTSVLLGLLTGSEKQFSSRSSSIHSQENYNILPLASSQIRFGLLPLSMSNLHKSKSSSRASSHQLTPPSTKADNPDRFQPGSLFRQLADQDEDSASPSLFKLSWLSGMSK